MSSQFENAMSDLEANNYTQPYPPMPHYDELDNILIAMVQDGTWTPGTWISKEPAYIEARKKLLEYMNKDNKKVTRLEVIDGKEDGRDVIFHSPKRQIELSYQDDDRTLKIFVTNRNQDPTE